MSRNLYKKKRSYQETVLANQNSSETEVVHRQPITIISQKSSNENSKAEVFSDSNKRIISAFESKHEHIGDNSHSSTKLLLNPFLTLTESTKGMNAPTNFGSISNSLSEKLNFIFDFSQPIPFAFEKDNTEKEESSEEDNYNPEEELEIKPIKEINDMPQMNIINQSEKYADAKLDSMLVYDFSLKQYISKGKGKLSLELFKDTNYKGIVSFRAGEGTVVLFQGNLIAEVSNYQESKKDLLIIVLNKIFVLKEGKLDNKSLKIKFETQKEKDLFIQGFKKIINDLKHHASKKEENKKQKEIEVNDQNANISQGSSNSKERKKEIIDSNQIQITIKNPFLEFLSSNCVIKPYPSDKFSVNLLDQTNKLNKQDVIQNENEVKQNKSQANLS